MAHVYYTWAIQWQLLWPFQQSSEKHLDVLTLPDVNILYNMYKMKSLPIRLSIGETALYVASVLYLGYIIEFNKV